MPAIIGYLAGLAHQSIERSRRRATVARMVTAF
jgi:hypothetical protein